MEASQAQAARRARRREAPQAASYQDEGILVLVGRLIRWRRRRCVCWVLAEGEPQNWIPFNFRYSRVEAISSSLENCSLNRAASSLASSILGGLLWTADHVKAELEGIRPVKAALPNEACC